MGMKRFSDKEVGRYIKAINKEAAQVWINAFAREPKLQQSYYWTLFSELFLKQLNDIPVSMSDAEKILTNQEVDEIIGGYLILTL
jgi:hypothetical protein